MAWVCLAPLTWCGRNPPTQSSGPPDACVEASLDNRGNSMNEEQAKGKAKQAEGTAQEKWGDVKEKSGDAVDDAKEKIGELREKGEDETDEAKASSGDRS
jgi:hypothetical protein